MERKYRARANDDGSISIGLGDALGKDYAVADAAARVRELRAAGHEVTLARSAQRRIDEYLAGRDPAEAPHDAADVRRALSRLGTPHRRRAAHGRRVRSSRGGPRGWHSARAGALCARAARGGFAATGPFRAQERVMAALSQPGGHACRPARAPGQTATLIPGGGTVRLSNLRELERRGLIREKVDRADLTWISKGTT